MYFCHAIKGAYKALLLEHIALVVPCWKDGPSEKGKARDGEFLQISDEALAGVIALAGSRDWGRANEEHCICMKEAVFWVPCCHQRRHFWVKSTSRFLLLQTVQRRTPCEWGWLREKTGSLS